MQVGQHLGRRARLGVDPDRAAELGELPVLLDVPVRREHQRLGGVAVAQRAHVLGADRVQPAQPVRPGDDEHVAVAAVDHAGAGRPARAARAAGRRSARARRRRGRWPARPPRCGGRSGVVISPGSSSGRAGFVPRAPACRRSRAHRPKTVKCERSRTKPRSRSRSAASSSTSVGLGVDDRAAGVADHVDVVVLGRPVGRRAVPEVGVPHQAELLEQLERAVDGGDVDARAPPR